MRVRRHMFLHNLSHYLLLLTLPPGLILIILLLGFILNWCKLRLGKILIATGYILLWLLSTQLFAQCLIDGLQKQYSPLAPTSITTHNAAIVVLGMGVTPALEYERKDVVSEKTMARVNYAAYLSKKTGLPVITSGGNRDSIGHFEAELMGNMLNQDYAVKVIGAEQKGRNTDEQSRLIIPILKANNIHTVYLVTNAWHMPRSMYAFKTALAGQDVQVIAAPMGYIALKSENTILNLMPFLNALQTSAYAMYEYFGLVWYHLHQPIYST
jgi:uncharacterized SAM-binding protein YcdF (DUF218 family)